MIRFYLWAIAGYMLVALSELLQDAPGLMLLYAVVRMAGFVLFVLAGRSMTITHAARMISGRTQHLAPETLLDVEAKERDVARIRRQFKQDLNTRR